ncbi:hypothetical protein E1287_25680 [Actinomadura sp. KC06]|uniref:hypothetical protein n=1 Tax=Actinomadura sp. KC06 TaxID=2530369 RepID=UPI00104F93ED|nr:hypothetical protein [Actinomadura sp. KC06]TDD31654.1 hypothetical protein E1287_25680 [Actinomadura sp. KC06]
MENTTDPLTSLCGTPIDVRTRADAIANGTQIEAPAEFVDRADLLAHVTLTADAWGRYVTWTNEDSDRTGVLLQDSDDRLMDILRALAAGIHRAGPLNRVESLRFRVACFRRDVVFGPDDDQDPSEVELEALFGRGADGGHLITVHEPR